SGADPLDKVIDVYICKLRKKIAEATGGARYIETVYGRGYKFEAPPEHEEAAPVPATVSAASRRFPAIPYAAAGLHSGCLVAAE
ncbi:winged helix-turn-helix domain-containing protein, partial [Roseomonas genomospecies 6]